MAVPTRNQIAFEELGLGAVLRRYELRVPLNQREYSWDVEPYVKQLLQDFARAINDDGPYFLGTIVTIPRAEGQLEVVDGQQRLATTALLLAAIRDYLKERGEQLIVDSINNDFLSIINREKRARVPRLTLNVDDNELFERIVTADGGGTPSRNSHKRLIEARDEAQRQVRRLVAALDEREHGDLLNRWVSFIEHRAIVVLLRVPAEHDAYKMFETLNDRGLRTSQADLIKNFLFGRAGARIEEVQTKWSYMRGALESGSDDEDITITFLRHALIVQRGLLREAEVYDAVQDAAKSQSAAVAFAGTLEMLANVYMATFNPEHERWNVYPDSVRKAIEVFNLFNIKPMRPLILAVAARMSAKEAAKTFSFLISLGVRLIVASSTRSESVEEPLTRAAKAVFEGATESAIDVKKLLAGVTPTDAVFQTAFESAKVSNTKLARYYLRSLEAHVRNDSEPWFVPQDDKAIINLEHILPRKPEGNWPHWSDEEVQQYATRLGNLALLTASANSDLKSQPFAAKAEIYSSSPYLLTKQIADVDNWTPEAINERQKGLAALATKTWPADA